MRGALLQEQRGPHKERMVQIIRDNARRLERMVHDVLELSRRDRVQPETIRVRPYLLTFIDEFAQNDSIPNESFRSRRRKMSRWNFDRAHLNQVLWNLMHNACGTAAGSPEACASRVQRRANRVELHVIDDGEGVARELQRSCSSRFHYFRDGTDSPVHRSRAVCATARVLSIWTAVRARTLGSYGRNRREPARERRTSLARTVP